MSWMFVSSGHYKRVIVVWVLLRIVGYILNTNFEPIYTKSSNKHTHINFRNNTILFWVVLINDRDLRKTNCDKRIVTINGNKLIRAYKYLLNYINTHSIYIIYNYTFTFHLIVIGEPPRIESFLHPAVILRNKIYQI